MTTVFQTMPTFLAGLNIANFGAATSQFPKLESGEFSIFNDFPRRLKHFAPLFVSFSLYSVPFLPILATFPIDTLK